MRSANSSNEFTMGSYLGVTNEEVKAPVYALTTTTIVKHQSPTITKNDQLKEYGM